MCKSLIISDVLLWDMWIVQAYNFTLPYPARFSIDCGKVWGVATALAGSVASSGSA
jgi:hypothetical protein